MRKYLVAAAILTAACGGAGSSGPPSTAQVAVESVGVLDPGKEPRQRLRYRLADRFMAEGVFVLRVVQAQSDGKSQQKNRVMPVVNVVFEAGPITRDASRARYDLTLQRVEVEKTEGAPEGPAQLARGVARALEDARVPLGIDDRGVALAQDGNWKGLHGTGDFDAGLLTILGSLQGLLREVPLPDGPIGAGSIWEVRRTVRIEGVELTEIGRYMITSDVGSQMRISLGLQQTATPQRLGNNREQEVELRSHIVRAEGYAVVDLAAPVPTEIYVEIESLTVFGEEGGTAEEEEREQQQATLHVYMQTPRIPDGS